MLLDIEKSEEQDQEHSEEWLVNMGLDAKFNLFAASLTDSTTSQVKNSIFIAFCSFFT